MTNRLVGRFEAKPVASINMTPLVPVLLVLFVVIAASIPSSTSSLTVDVSPADPGPLESIRPLPMPYVSVGDGGALSIEGARVDAEHFGPDLKALSERRGFRTVAIRAEAETSYGDYMKAVRLIRRQGLQIRPINEDIR